MGRKSSTPNKRKPRIASQVAASARARESQPVRRDRLLQLISEQAGGSRKRFAKLVGVGTTHISKWLDDAVAPGAAKLHSIAERTGASIDWLLGFEVPADREARTSQGDFALKLRDVLLVSAPPMAELRLLGDARSLAEVPGWATRMVRNVAAAWWEQQRMLLARQYGAALLLLSDDLDEASRQVADPRIATHMRQQSHRHRQSAALLRSGDAKWRELLAFHPGLLCCEVPGMLRLAERTGDPTVFPFLQAPFLALGGQSGVGVAWSAETGDEAIYIDAESLLVIHKSGGRFLTELTIAERFGPLPSADEAKELTSFPHF